MTHVPGTVPTLDELLPRVDYRMHHERLIDASPQAVWDALQAFSLSELPVGRALVLLNKPRGLLARGSVRQMRADQPFLAHPPIACLAEEPGRATLLAGAVQPWRLGGGFVSTEVTDLRSFSAFATPGWVKVAMDFRMNPRGTATLLASEIRVQGTDAKARRAFGAYWWVGVRPLGGALRKAMLSRIASRAVAAR